MSDVLARPDNGQLVTITKAYFDRLIVGINTARREFLEANPSGEGADVVTPYDHLLYGGQQ